MADETHPAARIVRAARANSGMSRTQLGAKVGRSAGTIGRWERGEWKSDEYPSPAMLSHIVASSGLRALVDAIEALASEDPATRFAAVARQEAQRQRERRDATPADRHDEGVEGGGR